MTPYVGNQDIKLDSLSKNNWKLKKEKSEKKAYDIATELLEAEAKALDLFCETEERNWIVPGVSEDDLSKKIHELSFEMFHTKTHWHKRIVRSGKNTLLPYSKNPPNRIIRADDILFFDFGPVFEQWEADLGRTYVIGNDPQKLRLKKDVEECWQLGKAYYDLRPEITGAELYRYVCKLAESQILTR